MNESHRRPPPLTWGIAGRLLLLGALIYAGLVGVGLLITRVEGLAGLRSWDQSVTSQVAARRTSTMDAVTHYMSSMSDTLTALVLTLVLVVAFRVWTGRWRESIVVVVAIAGELTIFLAVTNSIGRERPEVARLDPAPPTSSFPSGHTAAAVALYGALGVLLLCRLMHRRLAVVLATLCFAVPIAVAFARLYRGMHFPSDLLFGLLGGGLWLSVVLWQLLLRDRRQAAPA